MDKKQAIQAGKDMINKKLINHYYIIS